MRTFKFVGFQTVKFKVINPSEESTKYISSYLSQVIRNYITKLPCKEDKKYGKG